VSEYEQLAREHGRRREPRDLTAVFDRFRPIETTTGEVRRRLEAFAASKRLTLGGLSALAPRYKVESSGEVVLVFGYRDANGRITGVKYRSVTRDDGGPREVRPICAPQLSETLARSIG
jgi:hypothetical protein